MTNLYIMAGIYIFTGAMHFITPKVFVRIMPTYLPWPKALVIASGIAEIVLAIGLLLPDTRTWAAWGLIALLIAVFPANVEQVRTKRARMKLPMWVVILRLPLQLVLIYWAWLYT